MHLREHLMQELEAHKAMYIFRGGQMKLDDLKQAVSAVERGGGKFIEITCDHNGKQAESMEAIRFLKKTFQDRLWIGAGTILNQAEAETAIQAGSDFIVSPSLHKEVIDLTHHYERMCMPGACTCTEVVQAMQWDADFIKLFPIGVLGLDYAKALMKPIRSPRYFAVCNMDETMFADCLAAGFSGAGISSKINAPQLIAERRFDLIEERVRRYTQIARQYQANDTKTNPSESFA